MSEFALDPAETADYCEFCGCPCQTCAVGKTFGARLADIEGNDTGAATCGAQVDLVLGGSGECAGCHCKVDKSGKLIRF